MISYLRGLKNFGDTHLFLGHPTSGALDKTVVERGNVFSPGLWTFGISVFTVSKEKLIAPQLEAFPIMFQDDIPPITVSEYNCEDVQIYSKLCQLSDDRQQSIDYFSAQVRGNVNQCGIFLQDIGPAGKKISEINYDNEQKILKVDNISIVFETPINVEIFPPNQEFDSPCAIVNFDNTICFRVEHNYSLNYHEQTPKYTVQDAFIVAKEKFLQSIPATVYAPDKRILQMYLQTAYHIQAQMERCIPRINTANYPIFWLRDCVIVLRALDCMGRSDLARIGCNYLIPLLYSGGFGCESDNPGEGIWALVNHALITNDNEWLISAYPMICERVNEIEKMLKAEEPIYRTSDTRTIFGNSRYESDILCYKHEGNHIHGRMDWHSPDFYINCWASCGLHFAYEAAKRLNQLDHQKKFAKMADDLDNAIETELLPHYGNGRDSSVAPYPCDVFKNQSSKEKLKKHFTDWYCKERICENGNRIAEPLWTYFEAAQIHNAILLQQRDLAWKSLDGFLSDKRWLGMSLMIEGEWNTKEMFPFGKHNQMRGWLQNGALGANMPHNWTTSETFLMLQSIFVIEKDDHLELLAGVPKSWIYPGAVFGVRQMPTRFGIVDFCVNVNENSVPSLTFNQGENIAHVILWP